MVTPWADGLGEPGGEMEEWAEKRAAAGLRPLVDTTAARSCDDDAAAAAAAAAFFTLVA